MIYRFLGEIAAVHTALAHRLQLHLPFIESNTPPELYIYILLRGIMGYMASYCTSVWIWSIARAKGEVNTPHTILQ